MKEALIITLDDDVDDLEDPIDDDFVRTEILGLCGSFLEIRDSERSIDSRTIHLVHFSVKEFLLTIRSNSPSLGVDGIVFSDSATQNKHLARSCIHYLDFEKVWSSTEKDRTSRPFLDYAVKSWYKHLSSAGDASPDTIQLINGFFEPGNPNWNAWRTEFESTQDNQKQESNPAGPLYYASMFGLVDTMKWLREEQNEDPNAIAGFYGTALQAACANGHRSAVKQLCDSDVNINIEGGRHGTAINAAAYCRHQSIVQDLANLKADIAIKDIYGWTPLRSATYNGHLEMMNLLFDKGADVATVDNFGWTPLHSAIENDHFEVMKVLLDKGANIASVNNEGWTPLHLAAHNGHLEMMKVLLDKGANVATIDNDGWTSLHLAVSKSHIRVVKVLLDKGADTATCSSDEWTWTPLCLAADKGHLEMVQVLLDKGADIALADNKGWTPLHSAASRGHFTVVQLLLDKGADPTIKTSRGWNPLHLAIDNGRFDVMKLLLDKGADVAATDSTGLTSLHYAATRGDFETVKLLLDKGADPTIKTSRGSSPLLLAVDSGCFDVVKLLLDKGADVAATDSTGSTPLHYAAAEGDSETVKLLLDKGAVVAATDSIEYTPLHCAAGTGDCETVKVLLARIIAEKTMETTSLSSDGAVTFSTANTSLADEKDELSLSLNRKNLPNQTPLHLAAFGHHRDVFFYILSHRPDVNLHDGYGFTCFDYVRHDSDIIHMMESRKIRYCFTETSDQRNYVMDHLIKITGRIQSEPHILKTSAIKYHLGHCLLLLHDVEAACHFFQEEIEPPCDSCSSECTPGNWYACIECPETEICTRCMKLYPNLSTAIPGCTQHEFFEITKNTALDSPAVTQTADETEKAELQWLEELRLKYISMSESD